MNTSCVPPCIIRSELWGNVISSVRIVGFCPPAVVEGRDVGENGRSRNGRVQPSVSEAIVGKGPRWVN